MIPVNLVETLAEEIKDVVKDYRLKYEPSGEKEIEVYEQNIPIELLAEKETYPCVLVSVQAIRDDEDRSSEATIGITVGTYGADKNAWVDMLSILERLRQHFCKRHVIKGKYKIIMPSEWEIPEAPPYPFWFGFGILRYHIGQSQEVIDYGYKD